MKKLLIAALMTLCLPSLSYAQQANTNSQLLLRYPPGFRNVDGNQLNKMVDSINGGQICETYNQKVAAASVADETIFIASRAVKIISALAVYSTTNGGAMTAQLTKDTGTTAPAAGTALLSTAFNLNTTANTVQVGALVTTAGVTNLAAGNRVALDVNTAGTNLTGFTITICMAPLQ